MERHFSPRLMASQANQHWQCSRKNKGRASGEAKETFSVLQVLVENAISTRIADELDNSSVSPKKRRHHKSLAKHRPPKSTANSSHAHVTTSAVPTPSTYSSSSVSSEAYCICLTLEHPTNISIWFADSGVTEHIPNKRHRFPIFQTVNGKHWTISVVDDHMM